MNEELQRYNIYRGNQGNDKHGWAVLNKKKQRESELITNYLKEFLSL